VHQDNAMKRHHLPSRSRSTLAVAILLLLLLLGGAGIAGARWFMPDNAVAERLDYPQLWLENQLPQIPGRVTSVSTEGDAVFEMETPLAPNQVSELLEEEFEDRDWQFYETTPDSNYENEFFNEDMEVTIVAEPSARGNSRVRITIRQAAMDTMTPPTGLTSAGVMAVE
jgi:hypothetical protein